MMQLQTYIYLHIPVKVTFEQFLSILTELNTQNMGLEDTIRLEHLQLFHSKDSLILYNYINIMGNNVLFLLVVLFNQLQLVYYKTRTNCTLQEKYSMSLEFWKSQIREFIVCISLLQDSEYFKVKDASELKVSTLVVREILQLLTLDFDTKVLEGMEEIGLMDLQVIIDKIHHVPTLKCLIQGKSSNVLVLESEESVVITRYFYGDL